MKGGAGGLFKEEWEWAWGEEYAEEGEEEERGWDREGLIERMHLLDFL